MVAMSRSSGSMTWCLVVALSLLLVARVQPYPGYGEQMRSVRRYPSQVQALGDRRMAATSPNNNGAATQDDYNNIGDDEDTDYPRIYDYNDFLVARRDPDIFPYDHADASNKHLQQILRSFRSVVGGTSPSDRVIPWTELGSEAFSNGGGSRGVGGRLSSPATSLAQLSFAENRQKRDTRKWACILWVKMCRLGGELNKNSLKPSPKPKPKTCT